MINQTHPEREREGKFNCNHHLADVESLDIEMKHKKKWWRKKELEIYFFPLLSFSVHSCLLAQQIRKKNQVLSTEGKKKPRTQFHEKRRKKKHSRKFTLLLVQVQGLRGCVSGAAVSRRIYFSYVSYHFRFFFYFLLALYSLYSSESRFQYTVMTENICRSSVFVNDKKMRLVFFFADRFSRFPADFVQFSSS